MKLTALAIALAAVALATTAQAASLTGTGQQQQKQLQQKIQKLESSLNSVKSNHGLLSKLNQASKKGIVGLDGSKGVLFEGFPHTAFNLALLKARNKFANHSVEVGGYFEYDAQYWTGGSIPTTTSGYTYKNGSAQYLTTLNLDFMSNVNDWVTVFTEFSAAGMGTSSPSIEVKKAFVNIGNLDKTPLFVTIGKTYLPFGVFSGGGPWQGTVVRGPFRGNETNQIIFGFDHAGLNTNLSFFNTSSVGVGENHVTDFVYSMDYDNTFKQFNYNVGAGFINDVRGINSNIGSAYTSGQFTNSRRNGAVDLNGSIGTGPYTVTGEYDQTFHGANSTHQSREKMRAWDIGTQYSALIAGKTTAFGASYSRTYNMSDVPSTLAGQRASYSTNPGYGLRYQWLASASREEWKNTYLALEYGWARTYAGPQTSEVTFDASVYF
jgi:hypothetical protein